MKHASSLLLLTVALALTACKEATAPTRPLALPTLAASLVPVEEITFITLIPSVNGEWRDLAINDSGLASGYNEEGRGAFFWDGGAWNDILPDETPCQPGSVSDRVMYEGKARHINNAGQVVGIFERASCDGFKSRGWFIWQGGDFTEIPSDAEALAINDLGQVLLVGFSAQLWEAGVVTSLGDFNPIDLNNRGQIVGRNLSGGVLWESGTLTNLGFLPTAINDLGQIVGQDALGGVLWDNGIVISIPRGPVDINDLGQVLLGAPPGSNPCAVWQSGVFRELPTVPGNDDACVRIFEINNRGQAITAAGVELAVIYETLRTASPTEEVAILTNTVNDLVAAGLLTVPQSKPLLAILANAQKQIDKGNFAAAADVLEFDFIPKVQADVTQGILSAADGQILIDAAQNAIIQLRAT